MTVYQVFDSDPATGWTDVGSIQWDTDSGALTADTDNDAVQRIVDRVNQTDSWNTAPPPDYKDAPVAERSEPMDEARSVSLLKTYLRNDGFGIAKESAIRGGGRA